MDLVEDGMLVVMKRIKHTTICIPFLCHIVFSFLLPSCAMATTMPRFLHYMMLQVQAPLGALFPTFAFVLSSYG
jgi:hypothetical protein